MSPWISKEYKQEDWQHNKYVTRGGGADNPDYMCSSYYRLSSIDGSNRDYWTGIRLFADLPE